MRMYVQVYIQETLVIENKERSAVSKDTGIRHKQMLYFFPLLWPHLSSCLEK